MGFLRVIIFPGDRLKGWDVVKSGIATHFVPSKRLYELEVLLSRCADEVEVSNLLSKFHEPSDEFSLSANIKHINYCFAASSIEEIVERLEKVQNDWSVKTLKVSDAKISYFFRVAYPKGYQQNPITIINSFYFLL